MYRMNKFLAAAVLALLPWVAAQASVDAPRVQNGQTLMNNGRSIGSPALAEHAIMAGEALLSVVDPERGY
ncbi:MAG: hypothetical protein IMF06_09595 [Proteobacteria bacterium]|nr:hypothetical protein [Pseudomonadota bacterium]